MDEQSGPRPEPVTIKKYANRRLYNTATSSYVTLDHLCRMVKDEVDFVVTDAKTGEDITHTVLTQIIVDQEAKGNNLLPVSFLRRLIRFYDDSLQAFLPRYLEVSMETFARNQEQMRSHMQNAFGEFFPLTRFEEMGRKNLELIQRSFSSLAPESADGDRAATAPSNPGSKSEDEMGELKAKLNSMQRQLDELARKE